MKLRILFLLTALGRLTRLGNIGRRLYKLEDYALAPSRAVFWRRTYLVAVSIIAPLVYLAGALVWLWTSRDALIDFYSSIRNEWRKRP